MKTKMESKTGQFLITQDAFRILMDCLARPGKINRLADPGFTPPQGLYPFTALVLTTLLDGETSFAVLPRNDLWLEYIQANTGARGSEVSAAEYILANGAESVPDIEKANRGDLWSPEKGATLLFQVDRIEASPRCRSTAVTLQGPGVRGSRDVYISGLAEAHWPRLKHLNREYPLGVDLLLVAADGRVVGIPRSGSLAWEVIA